MTPAESQLSFEVPDFIARAIEAQGRTSVERVRQITASMLARDWRVRIESGEPTLDEALRDEDLFREHVAPFVEML